MVKRERGLGSIPETSQCLEEEETAQDENKGSVMLWKPQEGTVLKTPISDNYQKYHFSLRTDGEPHSHGPSYPISLLHF